MRDPTIYVLAGVNGSGKSSIGGAAMRANGVEVYDPDLAARRLRQLHPSMAQPLANGLAWKLGKSMLTQAIAENRTFAIETTLGGRTLTSLLIEAAESGHQVKIWYVGLESVELHIARVRSRVAHGGHDIPEADIRKRWDSSRRNLIRLLPALHSLRLFDNSRQADPRQGKQPQPRLLLHVRAGAIVSPKDLSHSPAWAKPIIAAALKACRGR